MRKLKVYGGNEFYRLESGLKQLRTIIATTSQKEVARIMNISLYEVKTYWAETGNDGELSVALLNPGVAYVRIKGVYMRADCVA